MKPALRWIPTEVWVDVFRYPGKSRKELGKIADKLGRKFAEFLQFYLHEWGRRTLGHLHFKEGIYKSKRWEPYAYGEKLDFVQTSMPENIKFFEHILISNFNSQTLHFLHRISTLFLMNDVNLYLLRIKPNSDLANLRTVLDHLTPLLHGIHSLTFNYSAITLVEQYFAPKLAQVKELTIYFGFQLDQATIQTNINFCMNWLTSEERDPAEARLLKVKFCSQIFQPFIMAVQQQFLSAKRQCTFAIKFEFCGLAEPGANFHMENDLGEQLDGQLDEYGDFQMLRHRQVDLAKTNLQEWVRETMEKSDKSSGIELFGIVAIGPLDANDGDNNMNDNVGEEEEDQPSTSKKPKLA